MTRYEEALKNAEACFDRVAKMQLTNYAEPGKAQGLFGQALAEAGRGYLELAKELRLGA